MDLEHTRTAWRVVARGLEDVAGTSCVSGAGAHPRPAAPRPGLARASRFTRTTPGGPLSRRAPTSRYPSPALVEVNGINFVIRPDGAHGRKLVAEGKPYALAARLTGPAQLEELAGELLTEAQTWRSGTHPNGPDPFKVLGVHPQASIEVITLLFKARAKREHPDPGGDATAWTAVQTAYGAIKAMRAGPARTKGE